MERSQKLLKVVGIYLLYFLYSKVAAYFAQTITLMNGKAMYLIFDIFFLIFICFLYYKDLKKDYESLRKDYSWKKILLNVVIYFVALIIINFIIMIIGELIGGAVVDANVESIDDIAKLSPLYAIFKTMIFGVVAEEILYRESLSECIDNNIVFIIISSLIYTLLPFTFNNSGITLMNLLIYFLPSLLISAIYVKNNRNILMVMIMKFVYNLIPLTILISGLIKG